MREQNVALKCLASAVIPMSKSCTLSFSCFTSNSKLGASILESLLAILVLTGCV